MLYEKTGALTPVSATDQVSGELRAYPKNVFAPSRPDMNVRAIHLNPSEDG